MLGCNVLDHIKYVTITDFSRETILPNIYCLTNVTINNWFTSVFLTASGKPMKTELEELRGFFLLQNSWAPSN